MEKDFIKIKPCKKINTFNADKNYNGWVLEVVSDEDGFTKHIKGQVYITVAMPGLFKGYHLHAAADYFITCLKGRVKETVYKNRDAKQEIEVGEGNLNTIFVPRGYPHGFKNIGDEPAYLLIYRYPAWSPELKEQLDISPEEIETEAGWFKINEFIKRFK